MILRCVDISIAITMGKSNILVYIKKPLWYSIYIISKYIILTTNFRFAADVEIGQHVVVKRGDDVIAERITSIQMEAHKGKQTTDKYVWLFIWLPV